MRNAVLILLFILFSATAWCGDNQVCIKGACVDVEITDTPQERMQGLMFRQVLAENEGMLFIFDTEDTYRFWMKNMNFPLDIIWINEDNIIVDIKANVPPCGENCEPLTPQGTARYVLEVNSGFAERHSIYIGDKAEIDIVK